jgi:DNA-binding PadR family transcriptional regulator
MSLRFATLGLLAEQPLHGYQVKQRFEDLLGGTWEVNIGQVYQTLQRLERDGLVETTGDRGDRGRQAYRTTDFGLTALDEWLSSPAQQPQTLREEVYVKLALLGRQADGRLEAMLDGQRRVYLQQLRDLADQERVARDCGRPELALLFRGAQLHTEADLKWLDACADELGGNGGRMR